MKILVSNDDGIHAPGIVLMANRLAALGHSVTVVAPDRERSGVGHAITTEHSLYLRKGIFHGYSSGVGTFKSNGTPADCVMLGLHLAEPDAELVLTGINSGPNLGCDVFYSGTAAAAREAYFENRRAVAVSLCLSSQSEDQHYETALSAVEALLDRLDDFFTGEAALLNMNVPNLSLAEVKGFKVAFAGRRRYQNRVQLSSSPEEEKYYWLRGIPAEHEELEGSDVRAVNSGFVAVTFLQHDTTDYELNKLVDPKIVDKIKLK